LEEIWQNGWIEIGLILLTGKQSLSSAIIKTGLMLWIIKRGKFQLKKIIIN